MAQRVRPDRICDHLLENDERFATTERLAVLLGVRPARVSHVLAEARHNREIVSVTKGGWAPVPAADRKMRRAPMVTDYLDKMMRFMGHDYYVGYVSAASAHGSHHYSHASCQIVTPRQHRSRNVGRTHLQFIRGRVRPELIRRKERPVGTTWITNPEATIFDLVARPEIAFGFHHVSTIIGDMLLTEGLLDTQRMTKTAAWYPRSVVQRVGYITEIMRGHLEWACRSRLDLGPLADLVHDGSSREVSLTGKPSLISESTRTVTGNKWMVLVDHVLDPAHKSRCAIAA